MKNSKHINTQRINVTSHLAPDTVATRLTKIKDLITANSPLPFKTAILNIAGINVGTFYNYIYPGKQMGQVSQYTIDNISNYFNLPAGIFTGESDLSDSAQNQIISILKKTTTSNPEASNDDTATVLKGLIRMLNNEDDISILSKNIELLELALKISKGRLSSLESLNSL